MGKYGSKKEISSFKKSKCLAFAAGLTSLDHLSYWTIHDSDVERAALKLSSREFPRLIFCGEALSWFFRRNFDKSLA